MVGRASIARAAPGFTLPAFERFAPPPLPADLLAQLEAASGPGDVVLDLFGRGAWVARASIDRRRVAVSLESTPLTRLLAEVVLRPPDLRHLDAAFAALGSSPRGDSSLRVAIGSWFAVRCPTCERQLVADECMWTRAEGEPELTRITYRCTVCRDQRGGLEQRAIEPTAEDVERAHLDVGAVAARALLRERFPVPRGAEDLPASVLGLHRDRQLAGLAAILERIEGDLRAAPVEAALRLAFLHAVMPSSRLGTGPGRVPGIRIAGGVVRSGSPDPFRERNPWLAFEEGYRLVRAFVQRLESGTLGPLDARLGVDLRSLGDGSATAVLGTSDAGGFAHLTAPATRGGPPPRIRLALAQAPIRWSQERLAAAWHGTAWALGRDAAASLPIDALAGPALRSPWSGQSAVVGQALERIAGLLARDGRAVILLDAGGPEALIAMALGGVQAGYRLVDAHLGGAEDDAAGVVEFVPPGAARPPGPRTRSGRPLDPIPGGSGDPGFVPGPGVFSPPEPIDARPFSRTAFAEAVTESAVAILRQRGEPASHALLLAQVLLDLDRLGHLARYVARNDAAPDAPSRTGSAGAMPAPGAADQGTDPEDPVDGLLALIDGELGRPDQRRLQHVEPDSWWLAAPTDRQEALMPLGDRVEWAVYSLLSTAGPLPEEAFMDRVAGLFPGREEPDPDLIRACLASYRSPASTRDRLMTGEDVRRRTIEHTELIARLVDGGHRLGMSVWIGRREQGRRFGGGTLGDLLDERERQAWLPGIARAGGDDLGDVDCIWYRRGGGTFLFEVEWTAMLGDVVRRHARIPPDDRLVRFIVLAEERRELARHRLSAAPLLREAIEGENWHVVLWPHMRAWLSTEPFGLEGLEPFLGLDPAAERGGRQLALFEPPEPLP